MRSLFLPILSLLGTVGYVVSAEEINPPAKFRFNKDLFTSMMNTGDEKIMETFKAMPLGDFESGDVKMENVSVSFKETSGALADFDFST
jgi:hypothetical protein